MRRLTGAVSGGLTRATAVRASVAIALLCASVAAQSPALRIVVIAGEDAVNVIQQKSAVRPVIEVRDRNDVPVPGAVVTFSIQGGAASFGGASTVSVATNAAGQAAVTSLTPTAAGAFQIQVAAAFQGQVATATIAQTNVMTAAQAAAAGAATGASGSPAGGGSGAAGGGSGLSTTTIVTTGAAIAGGAVAAVKIAENIHFDELFSGPLNGQLVNTSVIRATGVTCVTTYAVDATVNLEIDDGRGDRSDGHFEITGNAPVVSHSCGQPPPARTITWGGRFNGTDAAMRGTDSNAFSGIGSNGNVFQGVGSMTFEGARSGDTITATLTFESRSSNTSASGSVSDTVESGTYTVTLRKTGEKNEG